MRVGIGYDVHRLTKDCLLIMGGVEIPFEAGLLGHSDADVLVHAIMDALLGAAGLGDIGGHFPDHDNQYKGISSLKLLREVGVLLKDKGYVIVNIDSVIIAERPKMKPYIEEMTHNISASLSIDATCINVKATTTEGLGFEGNGSGIAAQAIALIEKANIA